MKISQVGSSQVSTLNFHFIFYSQGVQITRQIFQVFQFISFFLDHIVVGRGTRHHFLWIHNGTFWLSTQTEVEDDYEDGEEKAEWNLQDDLCDLGPAVQTEVVVGWLLGLYLVPPAHLVVLPVLPDIVSIDLHLSGLHCGHVPFTSSVLCRVNCLSVHASCVSHATRPANNLERCRHHLGFAEKPRKYHYYYNYNKSLFLLWLLLFISLFITLYYQDNHLKNSSRFSRNIW